MSTHQYGAMCGDLKIEPRRWKLEKYMGDKTAGAEPFEVVEGGRDEMPRVTLRRPGADHDSYAWDVPLGESLPPLSEEETS